MAYFEHLKTSVMKVVLSTLFFFCATFGLAQNKLEVLGNSQFYGIMRINGLIYQDYKTNSTVFGKEAGNSMTTGNFNVAFGSKALSSMTTGFSNVAIGFEAMYSGINSQFNIAIGNGALRNFSISGGENTAIGFRSQFQNQYGVHNTSLGHLSLHEVIDGVGNTAIGFKALNELTVGARNVAVGEHALFISTEAEYNVAIGTDAMFRNTTGSRNSAVGFGALYQNSTGDDNVGIGANALSHNTTGEDNSALGIFSLFYNTTGSRNAAVGRESLLNNTTGWRNSALGTSSLSAITTGSENVGVGFSAYSTGSNFSNSSALGYDAEPGASNTIRLGNDAVTTIGGNVDFTVTSDARFKTEVQEDVPGIAFIESLRPVTYHLDWQVMDDWRAEHLGERDSSDYAAKRDIEKIKFTGFLAQEVEDAAQDMGYDFSGVDAPDTDQQAYGLRYGTFVVPLVKATQEQQGEIRSLRSEVGRLKSESGSRKSEIEDLRSEIRDQKSENEALRDELDELRSMLEQLLASQPTEEKPVILNQSPRLEQNEPNPTNGTTRIQYFLPEGTQQATLLVTATNGQEIKRIGLPKTGEGQIDLQIGTLPPGTYNYSLVIDGQVVDTKTMIIPK